MMSDQDPDEDTLKQWHNDPDNWIWGIFYFNRRDKRIFPPKRIPQLGWTINFANPYSVITLVVFVAAVLILSVKV